MASDNSHVRTGRPEWIATLKKYQNPDPKKSIWLIINSVVPFFTIWYLMYRSLEISYWLTLGLAVLNAGFLVRIFIIQHDCGHNSFFKSRQANNFTGSIFGILTLTAYFHWRKQHDKHHATSGDLDQRGYGDIYTHTVAEYLKMNAWGRFKYRLIRHPLTLFVIGPSLSFIIGNRLPLRLRPSDRRERASVHLTTLAIVATIVFMGMLIGFKEFIMVQLPITILSTSAGVWLFYVQHQFESTHWVNHSDWDYETAALKAASYYKLPRILQWFTGNIGFHHVHHLRPRIPNYLLEKAHNENPIFHNGTILTIRTSIKCMFLQLWDEETKKLVGFNYLMN